MTKRALLFSTGLLAMLLLASPGFAQDGKPYAPHQFSRSELINFGTYDAPPLDFDFGIVDVEQQPEDKWVNFVITVDADHAAVVQHFETAYIQQQTAARLAQGIMPYQSTRELTVVGKSTPADNQSVRYMLGSKAMTRRFAIDISQEGGKTLITMRNLVISRLFSGVVPPRQNFKPKGAKPVHLLYN
ncbi:hypothetical protein FIV42_04945 [Persicimonas caeni]|uniref:DUF1795 domain-containing protein n=1 Tax=Persicimonas caeni TaxID=2292766 RepID=A0A4Y6PPH0_PERCE|nr:hypothetical protein [Persicimonas caeni]QDG50103.1 hypothetical protein FIV42_04945 [Persicimonas caeni]QED31324.1 hypothetical protein FRD00_04940 [Persicimonas caeni]